MTFIEWWDAGIGKPVDIGYDCAGEAWPFQEKRLAESQAREKMTRDAIILLYSWANNWGSEFMNDSEWLNQDYEVISKAIDQTADDTALKLLLAKERERCAKVCDMQYTEWMEATRLFGGDDGAEVCRANMAEELAKDIRELGDEK